MLQIKNLSITHKKDLRVILNDFSCVLNDGDKAVIIGEEGNGKSTLLKWIYDEKLVDDYCETEGELIQTKERIAYLPQELPKEKRTLTVCEFFMEEESFLEQTPKTLGQMAAKFHVPADFFYREQPMETLSGGEKVKAQMMKLLLTEPTVLLLDEPSNDIDVETLEWLERLIQNWKHIVLFISHDETLIENTANMIIYIEQIRRKTVSRYTIAKMSYEQYRKERLRNFENQERQAESERREKKIREEKLKRIYQSVDYAQETISRQNPAGGRLLKKKMHAVKSMERRFEKENEKWLDFVCACRKGQPLNKEYDIIIGNVADDDVFKTVDMYFRGLWNKEKVLNELRYYKMNNQICIVNQETLNRLITFKRAYEVKDHGR